LRTQLFADIVKSAILYCYEMLSLQDGDGNRRG